MKVTELCKMIEDSVRSGRYPLETETQKKLAGSLQVINRSDSEDMNASGMKIEVRLGDLYTVSNYLPNIKHLPGVIELDVLDSFKMICRKLDRLDNNFVMPS